MNANIAEKSHKFLNMQANCTSLQEGNENNYHSNFSFTTQYDVSPQ